MVILETSCEHIRDLLTARFHPVHLWVEPIFENDTSKPQKIMIIQDVLAASDEVARCYPEHDVLMKFCSECGTKVSFRFIANDPAEIHNDMSEK